MQSTNQSENQMHPLHPLGYGNVLIVGVKASNFDSEIRDNPRVIIWDSQQEHWTNKDMPSNTRAVFMTRFISHNTSTKLLKEARKRRITIFNPEGTGLIVKQVKELLDMNPKEPEPTPEPTPIEKIEEIMVKSKPKYIVNKLASLKPLVDLSIGNMDNAKVLMAEANRCGIDTTLGSLSQLVSVMRRKSSTKTKKVNPKNNKVDVTVEILDGVIKELGDMRDFLIATVDENNSLKAKVDKFKRFFDE